MLKFRKSSLNPCCPEQFFEGFEAKLENMPEIKVVGKYQINNFASKDVQKYFSKDFRAWKYFLIFVKGRKSARKVSSMHECGETTQKTGPGCTNLRC